MVKSKIVCNVKIRASSANQEKGGGWDGKYQTGEKKFPLLSSGRTERKTCSIVSSCFGR